MKKKKTLDEKMMMNESNFVHSLKTHPLTSLVYFCLIRIDVAAWLLAAQTKNVWNLFLSAWRLAVESQLLGLIRNVPRKQKKAEKATSFCTNETAQSEKNFFREDHLDDCELEQENGSDLYR